MELKHTICRWWYGLVLCSVVLSVAAQGGGNGAAAQNTTIESIALQVDETITLFDAFTLGETIPLPMCPQSRWGTFGKGCVYLPERLEIFEDLPIASMVDRLGLYEYREGQYPAVASTSHMFTLGVDEQDRLMYLRVTTRGLDVENEVMQMLTALLGEPKVIARRTDKVYNYDSTPKGLSPYLWGVSGLGSVVVIWQNDRVWARYVSSEVNYESIGYFDIGLNRILKNDEVPDEYW